MPEGFIWTGQSRCYDSVGSEVPCTGSGQDAEFRRGLRWGAPRFECEGERVRDALTGLVWSRSAGLAEFPLSWPEGLEFIRAMNAQGALGFADWRLPNRRELHSLISFQARRPALPAGHPFEDVFLGWYWSSTTAAISPEHAWYCDLDGGRLFYGGKDQSFMVWPVRGENRTLPRTGQSLCHDAAGRQVPCAGSGHDGEWQAGRPWPEPRFAPEGETVVDRLTGLAWRREADLTGGTVTWQGALEAVARLGAPWRLPNARELESLVDCARADPALADAGFASLRDGYWTATTSVYEPDWAWALYTAKGAVGVGQKKDPHFAVWPVCDATDLSGSR